MMLVAKNTYLQINMPIHYFIQFYMIWVTPNILYSGFGY